MSYDVRTMSSERALDLRTLLSSSEYSTARDFFRNDPYWQKSITDHDGVALLYELVRVIRPSIVVEIGTFEGRTARAIAGALLRNGSGIIHTVGPFDRDRFLPLFECWPEDIKRHARYHALSSMDFYIQADQQRMRFDLVFVDGNHDYEFALFDIQAAATRMMPGGVVVIDNISQAGPYYAAVDFLRARPEWADCGTPRTSISLRPYDRERANVPGTDFMILQGPSAYHVGARPVSFNISEWDRNSISGVKLMLSVHTTGTVHAQCILRGFGDDQIEVANGITRSIDSQQGSAVVSGQHILRLVAVGADSQSDGRHALGVRFSGLTAGGIYRAVAWVKEWQLTAPEPQKPGMPDVNYGIEPAFRVMMETRDSIDPNTGKPSNYGIARFDLGARSVVDSTGDIIASGVEAAADGWVKLWVDLRSRDGETFAHNRAPRRT